MKSNFLRSQQVNDVLKLLSKIFQDNLLGVYLTGSAAVGGLQKYSDLDFFVLTSRASTEREKACLAKELLGLSGLYMKCEAGKRALEVTVVNLGSINPWRYPPSFDFQCGE